MNQLCEVSSEEMKRGNKDNVETRRRFHRVREKNGAGTSRKRPSRQRRPGVQPSPGKGRQQRHLVGGRQVDRRLSEKNWIKILMY